MDIEIECQIYWIIWIGAVLPFDVVDKKYTHTHLANHNTVNVIMTNKRETDNRINV